MQQAWRALFTSTCSALKVLNVFSVRDAKLKKWIAAVTSSINSPLKLFNNTSEASAFANNLFRLYGRTCLQPLDMLSDPGCCNSWPRNLDLR